MQPKVPIVLAKCKVAKLVKKKKCSLLSQKKNKKKQQKNKTVNSGLLQEYVNVSTSKNFPNLFFRSNILFNLFKVSMNNFMI